MRHPIIDYHDTADQLRQHLLDRANYWFGQEQNEKAAYTRESFARRRQQVKAAFLAAIGGLPEVKTPLNVETTGVCAHPGFRMEKLVYQSLPHFYVTAHLYLPEPMQQPAAAVLFVCGHAQEAKAYPVYQQVCRDLVLAGFVVLAIDPIGQGERLQYYDPATGKCTVPWGVHEHSHAGYQCTLIGANIARYFTWDAIRGIDLLVARPEVDARRIGVTGHSGGGVQTSLLCMLEPRLSAAVDCTYVNERQLWMTTGKPQDAEQNYYGAIRNRLNYDDFLAAMAPRPVQIGAVASDFFPIEGTLAAYHRLRQVYSLFNAAGNVRLVIDHGLHDYTHVLRREAVAFFARHLQGKEIDLGPALAVAAGSDESPLAANIPPFAGLPPETEPVEALQCTKSAQVLAEYPDARSVYDLNLDAWHQWRTNHPQRNMAEVRLALEEAIRSDRAKPPLWVRRLWAPYTVENLWWQPVYYFSEPGIAIAAAEVRAPEANPQGPLAVVVCDEGILFVANNQPYLQSLVNRWGRLLLIEPRGTGASLQRDINMHQARDYFGTEYTLNDNALMLGDSLFAMRTYDLDRGLEYARRIAPVVSAVGKGSLGLCLLAACALQEQPVKLELVDTPRSWERFVHERVITPDFGLSHFGLLHKWDVEDLVSLVEATGGCVSFA